MNVISGSVTDTVSRDSDENKSALATVGSKIANGWEWSFRYGVVAILGGLLLWEGAVWFWNIEELLLPAPSAVGQAYKELWQEGIIRHHIWVSVKQLAAGYSIAVIIGVTLGLLIGQFRFVRSAFEPWVTALYTMPNIALAPLFIVWLGFDFRSKAVVIAFVAVFPITINTIGGVDNLRTEWKEVSDAFHANAWEKFFKVTAPGALPSIFTGLRLGVGRGVVAIVLADYFGANAGLGFFILRSAQNFRTEQLFVGIITLSAFGIGLTAALKAVEAMVSPWRKSKAT
jgi:NitT/TauT family transport system permease protein